MNINKLYTPNVSNKYIIIFEIILTNLFVNHVLSLEVIAKLLFIRILSSILVYFP